MSLQSIALIQPRYPHGGRQIYLPGSLLNLGSRLRNAGMRVHLVDLNLDDPRSPTVRRRLADSDAIGITVLGTPYIPDVVALARSLRRDGHAQPILVGGEGIAYLTAGQFTTLFHPEYGVHHIADDDGLKRQLGLGLRRLDDKFATSMVPMLERLPTARLRDYLTREFCLFLSHGCVYNCHFCAAAKDQRETYRDRNRLLEEVEFMAAFLRRMGHGEMRVYLSNLDALQNAAELERSLTAVKDVCAKHSVDFRARALATTHFTSLALRRDPQVLHRLASAGLRMLGFGVDGVSEETWRRQNKTHNKLSEVDDCLRGCQEAGIEPEALMVIGFPSERMADTLASIRWSLRQAYRHDVAVRAYLGKEGVPGSRQWAEDASAADRLLSEPEGFRHLDYTMLATRVSHPDASRRIGVNAAYLALLALLLPTRYATPPLLPIPRHPIGRALAKFVNARMPFDP